MFTDRQVATIATWIGLSFEEVGNCWQLVRNAYALVGVELERDFYSAMPRFRELRTSERPEPGDLVTLYNPKSGPEGDVKIAGRLRNHVGVCLGQGRFIHALGDHGVTIGHLDREPWKSRIRGFVRLRAS